MTTFTTLVVRHQSYRPGDAPTRLVMARRPVSIGEGGGQCVGEVGSQVSLAEQVTVVVPAHP